MGFLKRALLAVTRKSGRTVVLLIIMLVISDLVLAGFAIRHATEQAGIEARRSLGSSLTLYYNMQGAFSRARASDQSTRSLRNVTVPKEIADKIAAHPHVSGVNYLVNGMALADGFEPVVMNETVDQNTAGNNALGARRGPWGMAGAMTLPDVAVNGVAATELLDLFKNEEAVLTNGRHIAPADSGAKVVLIEKNLAEQNKLTVGKTIRLKPTGDGDVLTATIIGIYELRGDTASQQAGPPGLSFNHPYNRIYSDYKSASALRLQAGTDQDDGMDTVVFYVDDPVNIEDVRTYASSLPLDWEQYTLDANDRAYRQMMEPANRVTSFATMMMWIVGLAGALVLSLVLTLSIRERMYETGVLLALGETRIRVVAQYVTEVLIIAAIAFSLSLVVGQWSAQAVGSQLLDRQLNTQTTVAQERGDLIPPGGPANPRLRNGLFGGLSGLGNRTQATPVDELNITVSAIEARNLALAGLLIVVVATMVPAAMVMRYNPKQILTRAG